MKHKLFIFAAFSSAMLPSVVQAQPKNVAKSIRVIGIVAGAPQGQQLTMRANGQTYRVTALPYVSLKNVHGGDRVRVWGIPTRANLQRANVRVIAKSASNNPDDYNPAGR